MPIHQAKGKSQSTVLKVMDFRVKILFCDELNQAPFGNEWWQKQKPPPNDRPSLMKQHVGKAHLKEGPWLVFWQSLYVYRNEKQGK